MTCNIIGSRLNTDKKFISKTAKTERIVEIKIKAPVPHIEKIRPSLNLALVLDRSGSMSGEKLEYVKQAAKHVLDQLTEQDQVTLVVYDDSIQVMAHSMKVSNGNRFELKQGISRIHPGSMTNLADGWLTGCKEIASSAQDGSINRTLLLTDGLANVGITDLEILSRHALELYKDSISTSTFGVGEGFNEHLLEAMSNNGGGNFYYIAQPERIPEIFLKEFNQLIGITARKVEIRVDLQGDIEWQVLGGWAAEYKDKRLHIFVGDMVSGKIQDIYLKLQIPGDEKADNLILNTTVFGLAESGQVLEDHSIMEFTYADQKVVDSAPENNEVMQNFSVVEMADTAAKALKLERKGQREEADRMLRQNIGRSRPYISPQAAMNYENMSDRIKRGMTETDRKSSQFDVYNIKRKKDQEKE